MKTLQLALKKKWFDMIKSGEKLEEYREITPYWCARFLQFGGKAKPKKWWDSFLGRSNASVGVVPAIGLRLKNGFFEYNHFNMIKFSLGYPKSTDLSRILSIENRGFSIGKGRPEWGAEPDKYYFVFTLGEKITEL
jgi:hypothetical protein